MRALIAGLALLLAVPALAQVPVRRASPQEAADRAGMERFATGYTILRSLFFFRVPTSCTFEFESVDDFVLFCPRPLTQCDLRPCVDDE